MKPQVYLCRFTVGGMLFLGMGVSLLADMGGYRWLQLIRAKAEASSMLEEAGRPPSFYAPERAVDGLIQTAWCVKGPGLGEHIKIRTVSAPGFGLLILGGAEMSKAIYYENNRVKDYTLSVKTKEGRVIQKAGRLPDNLCQPGGKGVADCNLTEESCRRKWENLCYTSDYAEWGDAVVQFPGPECVEEIDLTIRSVYPGSKYNDTCVAEILVINRFPAGAKEVGPHACDNSKTPREFYIRN